VFGVLVGGSGRRGIGFLTLEASEGNEEKTVSYHGLINRCL